MLIRKFIVAFFVFAWIFFQRVESDAYYPNYPRVSTIPQDSDYSSLTLSALISHQTDSLSFSAACKKLRQARLLFVQENFELAMQDIYHALLLNDQPKIQLEALLLAKQVAYKMSDCALNSFQEPFKIFPGFYNLIQLDQQQGDPNFFKKYKEACKAYRLGNKIFFDESTPKRILLISPNLDEAQVLQFFEAAEKLSFFESIQWVSSEDFTKDKTNGVDLIVLIFGDDALMQSLMTLKIPICFVGQKPSLLRSSDSYLGIDNMKRLAQFQEEFTVQPDHQTLWILSEKYQKLWLNLCQQNPFFERQNVQFIHPDEDLGQQLEVIFAVPHRRRYFQELLGPKINYVVQPAVFPRRIVVLLEANPTRLVSAFVRAHAQHQVELYALEKVISHNKILDKSMIGSFILAQQDIASVGLHLNDLPKMIPFLGLLKSDKTFVYHGANFDYSYDGACIMPLVHYKYFT